MIYTFELEFIYIWQLYVLYVLFHTISITRNMYYSYYISYINDNYMYYSLLYQLYQLWLAVLSDDEPGPTSHLDLLDQEYVPDCARTPQHPLLNRLLLLLHCRGANLHLNTASACLYSRYRSWYGRKQCREEAGWFWPSLHAEWCARARRVCDRNYWRKSFLFEAKSEGHRQKSSRGFCLPHVQYFITKRVAEAVVHHHQCKLDISYIWLNVFSYLYILYIYF